MMKKLCFMILVLGLSIGLYACHEGKSNVGTNNSTTTTTDNSSTSSTDELEETTDIESQDNLIITNVPQNLVIKFGERVDPDDFGITATDLSGNSISDLTLEIQDTSYLAIGDHQISMSVKDNNSNNTATVDVNITVEDYDSLQEGIEVILPLIPEYDKSTVNDYFKVMYVLKAIMHGVYPTQSELENKICPFAKEINLSPNSICWNVQQPTVPGGVRFYYENDLIYMDASKSYLVGASYSSNVAIPDSVITIGDFAYANHEVYRDLYLPDSVQVIGDYAFYNLVIDGQFNIPDSIEIIGDEPFMNMRFNNSGAINVPDNLISVGVKAFSNLRLDENITLNENIKYIGDGAFSYAYYLNTLTVPEGNPCYKTIDGVLYDNSLTTIIHYPRTGGTVTSFPDTITTIGSAAFSSASLPDGFTIPDTVTKLGDSAFNSSTLSGELVLPSGLETIGDKAFYSTNITGELNLPSSIVNIGNSAFDRTNISGKLIIPDSLKVIGINAFMSTQIETLILGNSIEEIKNGAFSIQSLSGEVIIPDSTIKIGDDAFAFSKITEIVIGENMDSIGRFAFPDTLKSVVFRGLQAPSIKEETFKEFAMLEIYYKKDAVGFDGAVWQKYMTGYYVENATDGFQPFEESIPMKDKLLHPFEPLLYFINEKEKKLYRYNYLTQDLHSVTFDYPVQTIAYYNNEIYITITKEAENSTDYRKRCISEIIILNETTLEVNSRFDVNINVFSMTIDSQGYIYVSSDYFSEEAVIQSYNHDGDLIDQYSFIVALKTQIAADPLDNKIYTLDTIDSPVISALITLDGELNNSYRALNYDDNVPKGDLLQISPDGLYLFNSSGSIYSSTEIDSVKDDIILVTNLSSRYRSYAFDIEGNRLYALSINKIDVYDYNTFEKLGYYTYEPQSKYSEIFFKDGQLIIVESNGVTFLPINEENLSVD